MKACQKTISLLISVLLINMSMMGSVQAAMITNAQVIDQAQQLTERDNLMRTLQRADVQEKLLGLGVSAGDVKQRISQMTSEEIAQLNHQIENMPAGSGALGVVLLVFIVFVITDVMGATDIFPFIHPVKK